VKTRGFTLIELLVVVAIISLLVSILVPSLQKAKELAKQTLCATQLHQIGVGTAMYGGDYEGCFGGPGIYEITGGADYIEPAYVGGYPYNDDSMWMSFCTWKSHMCAFIWYWPYLGKVARYTQNLNDFWTLDVIAGQPITNGVWACPSNITPLVGFSYVYNEYLSNARKGTFQNPLFSANRVHQGDIKNAADVYIHGDEHSYAHGNGRNFLFVDSHVEFVYDGDPEPIIYPE